MEKPDGTLRRVANFRDVGWTVNRFRGERRVREGLIYRSARPDEATPDDKLHLRDALGIKTIIDLRTRTERLKQAEKRKAAAAQNGPNSHQIDAIEYKEINLAGRSLEYHLLNLLTWWDFLRAFVLYILGYRLSVARIISASVMIPHGPISLGMATLDHSGPEICQALMVYTSPRSLPALVHCTHGKDRSGLVCALILMILGIPRPAIEHDYALSDEGLVSVRHVMLEEMGELGLPDEWSRTSEAMIAATEKHLAEKYGGLEGYLDWIGFDQGRRDKLREVLLLDPKKPARWNHRSDKSEYLGMASLAAHSQ